MVNLSRYVTVRDIGYQSYDCVEKQGERLGMCEMRWWDEKIKREVCFEGGGKKRLPSLKRTRLDCTIRFESCLP